MLTSAITRVVDFCTQYPLWIIVLGLGLATGSSFYAARHFAIRTDVYDLLSPDLSWNQDRSRFLRDFPQREILIVVDAPTPELAGQASTKLAGALREHPEWFPAVSQVGSGSFYEGNVLLFLPTAEVERMTTRLSRGDVFLGTLAADPSLRGVLRALSLVLVGVEQKYIKLDDVVLPLDMAADSVEAVLAGRPASFSWSALTNGRPAEPQELRRFIQVEPVLDFSALQPGRAATDVIFRIASELKLDTDFQAMVRQTGRIPMEDHEFGSIKQNAGLNITTTNRRLPIASMNDLATQPE